MPTVSATAFARNFAEYQDVAHHEVVEVQSHGRTIGAFISPRELARYRDLAARERQVYEAGSLPDDALDAIRNAEYPENAPDLLDLMKD